MDGVEKGDGGVVRGVLSNGGTLSDQDLHFGLHTEVYWVTTVNGTFAG